MKILVVFGGQGVRDFNYDLLCSDEEGAGYLAKASKILNFNLLQSVSKISDPGYSQLLIGIFQLGVFTRLFEALQGHELGIAGYSFGGISAFLASIHSRMETSIDLIKFRTELMTSALPKSEKFDLVSISGRFHLEEIKRLLKKDQCEIAIINSDSHLIVGGKVSDLRTMLSHADSLKIEHFHFLSIQEPSHTSYYEKISGKLTEFLRNKFGHSTLKYPILSPISQKKVEDIQEELDLLGHELSRTIHWHTLCRLISEYGYERILDIGPGSAMTGILSNSGANLEGIEIVTAADFKSLDGIRKYLYN